ncbi:MAG: hypothetical protein ACYTKD_27645 [Planctomycetota bacterium]
MAESDDLDRLPLPKCSPKFVRRALVLACSMLKAAFDIEVGRRLHCNRPPRTVAPHYERHVWNVDFPSGAGTQAVRACTQ